MFGNKTTHECMTIIKFIDEFTLTMAEINIGLSIRNLGKHGRQLFKENDKVSSPIFYYSTQEDKFKNRLKNHPVLCPC